MTEETTIKTEKSGLMGIFSLILGAGGVFLSYYFIYAFLADILAAETDAAQECGLTAPFYIPAFACIGILGGILWLAASVGFFQKKDWAYNVAIIAVVISLFANMWPNIPAMESKAAVPGPWFLLFFPNLLVYFYLIKGKGKEPMSKAWLGLGFGMAFILNFINAIAATTRMVNRLPDYEAAWIYMLTMPTNMIASALFGLACVGLFVGKKKEIVRAVALVGTFMAISAGFPLAFYSMFVESPSFAFSMFTLGPVVSLVVGLIILSPKMWNKIMKLSE